MTKLRIAFSGIGGVGGYYGGMLAERYRNSEKADLFFIARGENLKAIREKGLCIKLKDRSFTTHPALVTDRPSEIGEVDYLFCCTKSYDLEANIDQLRPLIGAKTVVIPLLNGLDISERIQAVLPGQEVWKGCVYIGSRLIDPGVIHKFSLKDQLYFGSDSADKAQQKEVLDLFTEAHVMAFNPGDIHSRIWKKFFMISTAATATSYFNENIGVVLTTHLETFTKLSQELKHIADTLGAHLPEDIVPASIERQKMMPPSSTTSMHADFLAGKRSELESLTGFVVRKAEELGIDAPIYKMMYEKLKDSPYAATKE